MFNQSPEKSNFTKRVLFVGIPDMAYICLDGLHLSGINIVGVMGPKKSHPTYETFKSFVHQKGLNYIDYDSLKDPEFVEKIKNLNVDIAVVCSFNNKIPKVLLDAVKGGFINVHPSLLPKYRGANPYSSVIINGETETGVTLHFMDENFDTGDIVVQRKIQISETETMGTVFNRTNLLAYNMLVEMLIHFENAELPRHKQPQGEFQQCNISKEDSFLIDYKKDAKSIERFVRGLNPFLIATTNFRQNMVKVFCAKAYDEKTDKAPGEIAKIENGKIFIATGNGLISPEVIQFGSFFVGTSKDFINLLNPKEGESFL